MKKGLYLIFSLFIITSLMLAGCTKTEYITVTDTITSTTTLPAETVTTTETVVLSNLKYVSDFLAGAKNSYINYTTDQRGTTIIGISAEDFMSLSAQSNTLISMNGQLYEYRLISVSAHSVQLYEYQASASDFGGYRIEYSDPSPGTQYIAGTPTLVQVYEEDELAGEFTAYEIGVHISNSSVLIEAYNVGNLTFLIMYYSTNFHGDYERLWMVLSPCEES
jgi:uncharacterized protein YcfL